MRSQVRILPGAFAMTERPENREQPGDSKGGPERSDGKIPRPAIFVAIAGVVASLAIYGLSFVPGAGSVSIKWDSNEPVASPPARQVGPGTFEVARTSLAALAPNDNGELLFRVAGVIRVDSGGPNPIRVRCDIASRAAGDTEMARSTRLRAAWPKPSDRLQAQDVPETSFVRFESGDARKFDLPIRDVARRYVDTDAPTLVDWDGYVEDNQNWIWTMPEGTGTGAATLPWLVIFEAEDRPRGLIDCVGTIDGDRERIRIPYLQEEWPIADDQPNAEQTGEGDATNVE